MIKEASHIFLYLVAFLLLSISCSEKKNPNLISPDIFRMPPSNSLHKVDSDFYFESKEAEKLNAEGIRFASKTEIEKARDRYQKALVIEPEHPAILTNLANIELHDKNSTKSIVLYNKAIEISDSTFYPAIVSLSAALLRTNDNQKSIDLSIYALDITSNKTNRAGVYLNLIIAYLNLGDCVEAKKYFEILKDSGSSPTEKGYKEIVKSAKENLKFWNC